MLRFREPGFVHFFWILVFGILTITKTVASHSQHAVMNTTFPAEWEPHELTFMQWPASFTIWDNNMLLKVREDIAKIAKAIADFEQVVMLVSPDQVASTEQLLDHPNIKIEQIQVNDLWARDTMPAFTFVDKKLRGLSFNFNGWGGKQEHGHDSLIAKTIMEKYNVANSTSTWLVAEGGSLENDGAGTLLVTKSSLLNENRNPDKEIEEIEAELKRTLGVQKVIWFDGVYDKDITDAHVDCLVRFLKPGVVLLNRPHPGSPPDEWSRSSDQAKSVLDKEMDAGGRKFKIIEIFEPNPNKFKQIGNEFVSSYVNFYIANGAVILPAFGDQEADTKAQDILRENFPGRVIVPVNISALASGGGGIHCSTHELPSASSVVLPSAVGLLFGGILAFF